MIFQGIVAMGQYNQIGLKNHLPWRNKVEMEFFKRTISGHLVIMGRKTYESIGKPLPNVKTIIIGTKRKTPNTKDVFTVSSPEEAVELASFVKMTDKPVYICGGKQVYKFFIPKMTGITISRMDYTGVADTYFPPFEDLYELMDEENHPLGSFVVEEWRFKL